MNVAGPYLYGSFIFITDYAVDSKRKKKRYQCFVSTTSVQIHTIDNTVWNMHTRQKCVLSFNHVIYSFEMKPSELQPMFGF